MAAFVVRRGDRVIAHVRDVPMRGQAAVPTDAASPGDAGAYSIYAVINGVTTEAIATTNPNARVRAVLDGADAIRGSFVLIVD